MKTFLVLTASLSFLSLISNLFLTLIYFRNKSLQKHPAPILAYISIFEIVLSQHSIELALDASFSISGFASYHLLQLLTCYNITAEKAKLVICAINQVMFTSAAAGVLCYNTFFCVDFIITFRNPLFPGKKRMKIYNICGLVIITLEFAYNIFWNTQFDECEMDGVGYLYEFWNNGMLVLLYFVYAIIGFFSAYCCIYKIFTKGQYLNPATKDYFSRHVLYICVLLFIYTWTAVNFGFDYFSNKHYDKQQHTDWFLYSSTTLVASSGLIQALIRSWEKSYYEKLKELLTFKNSKVSHLSVYESFLINTDTKHLEDSWNIPTSLIMQESIRSNTTLCILWGIHQVLAKEKEESKESETHKILIDDNRLELFVIHFYSFNYFIIEEHNSKEFKELRDLEQIDIKNLLNSVHPENNKRTLMSSHKAEGRSGSLFIFTEDRNWVIKIISRAEMKFFKKKLAKKYLRHFKDNKYSFLNKIIGLYTVKIPGLSNLHLILSSCLINENTLKFYDLKGSTHNRLSGRLEGSFKGPFKDIDFINEFQKFSLHPQVKEVVISHLKNDAQFLMKCNIMDYSLLVTVQSKELPKSYPSQDLKIWYGFNVIDFLGEFSLKRKAEYYVKKMRMGKKIELCSVMNPKRYYLRFIKFMLEKVIC